MKKILTLVLAMAALASASFVANAEVVRLPPSNISAVLIDKDNFGGCMAQVDIDISETAPSCGSSYITFDCDGDFQDPSVGNRFLEMAQVAYVTGKGMRFSIDTNLQHNGFCVATRADLK
ncbi:hypothetical protein [Idiomarina ramblicola]|uniref:Uncharacterized protein n=1 Tax=Idiomarina ramblicola TaxID=263724 RepID=A0A432Z1J9_9GAMM|nr:hypothetical protein [Idiomarina ramblicola]RUO71747.1 hypothetical protein CWI78_04320 [Idiomarina ramblicola]